jgi:predicted phosphodiesterase
MRLFATSDLHVDFRENREVLEQVSREEFREDALIVAGDVAHRLELVEASLALLKERFREVFYVPGNHELWVRQEGLDSLEKFHRLLELCRAMGVRTRPGWAGQCWIVPLFSWYSASFDRDGQGDAQALDSWNDFHFCRWPEAVSQPDAYFACLNEPHLRSVEGTVLSFSHFLPRPELLPSVEHLRFRGLPKVAGCLRLEAQIRALGARVHVFGHSHIRRDVVLEEVRYVQHHLGYPQERRGGELFCKELEV